MENNNRFAEKKFLQITDFLKSKEAKSLNLNEVEEYLQKEGRELLDLLIKERVGDVGQSVTGTDGIKRAHLEQKKSSLYSEK